MPRGARRPSNKPVPKTKKVNQSDLLDLLASQTAPNVPTSWFEPPWKDGRNAIWLLRLIEGHSRVIHDPLIDEVRSVLAQTEPPSSDAGVNGDRYWNARELKLRLRAHPASLAQFALLHGLDMYQHWIASSDGGGTIYNRHLLDVCEYYLQCDQILSSSLEEAVLRARTHDAVGTERARVVRFHTAWKAGLFKIAYTV